VLPPRPDAAMIPIGVSQFPDRTGEANGTATFARSRALQGPEQLSPGSRCARGPRPTRIVACVGFPQFVRNWLTSDGNHRRTSGVAGSTLRKSTPSRPGAAMDATGGGARTPIRWDGLIAFRKSDFQGSITPRGLAPGPAPTLTRSARRGLNSPPFSCSLAVCYPLLSCGRQASSGSGLKAAAAAGVSPLAGKTPVLVFFGDGRTAKHLAPRCPDSGVARRSGGAFPRVAWSLGCGES